MVRRLSFSNTIPVDYGHSCSFKDAQWNGEGLDEIMAVDLASLPHRFSKPSGGLTLKVGHNTTTSNHSSMRSLAVGTERLQVFFALSSVADHYLPPVGRALFPFWYQSVQLQGPRISLPDVTAMHPTQHKAFMITQSWRLSLY